VNRGDVWWVSFDPSIGGETQKTRPAVIVSNDAANSVLNRLVVVPLTSKTMKLYPGQAFVTLRGERRKAMADQITTVSKLRLRNLIGCLTAMDLLSVESAILQHLAIRRYPS
jgi:mRNA interferase MazF